MRTYFSIVFGLALLAILFGFALPWLISQDDSVLVAAGFGIFIFIVPVYLWIWVAPAIKAAYNTLKKEENNG